MESSLERWVVPAAAGSFQGPRALSKAAGTSEEKAKDYLEKHDGYTLHKPPRRRFPRRKVVATTLNSQWMADLLDVSNLSSENNNVRYLLLCIDVVSRKVYGVGIKDKKARTVAPALENIFDNEAQPINFLQTDGGSEFWNKDVQKILKKRNIRLFMTNNFDIKASHIERFNKLLKHKISVFLTENNTRRYIDHLQDFIRSYNNSYHTSLGMTPNQVNHENVTQAIYFDEHERKSTPSPYKVGTFVRLLGSKDKFNRHFHISWTEEIFQVSKVLYTAPITYRIQDFGGEEISGNFYHSELNKIKKPEKYQWEKILKYKTVKGQKYALIKWLGWDERFNTWEKLSDIERGHDS